MQERKGNMEDSDFLRNIPRRPRTPRVDVTDEYIKKQEKIVTVNSSSITATEGGSNSSEDIQKTKRKKTSHPLRISDDGQKKKQQKTSHGSKQKIDPKKLLTASGLLPPPDMKEELKSYIQNKGGTHIKLVIQKIIYAADVSPAQGRLSIPKNQVLSKFLSEAEEDKLNNGEELGVLLIQPCLHMSHVHMTTWKLGGRPAYILKKEWNQVVKNNKDTLKENAVVQVWSFRLGLELCFAMAKVRDGIV